MDRAKLIESRCLASPDQNARSSIDPVGLKLNCVSVGQLKSAEIEQSLPVTIGEVDLLDHSLKAVLLDNLQNGGRYGVQFEQLSAGRDL